MNRDAKLCLCLQLSGSLVPDTLDINATGNFPLLQQLKLETVLLQYMLYRLHGKEVVERKRFTASVNIDCHQIHQRQDF